MIASHHYLGAMPHLKDNYATVKIIAALAKYKIIFTCKLNWSHTVQQNIVEMVVTQVKSKQMWQLPFHK